ncbi:hypothetical protein GCM10009837_23790 [Streptomyces durmitorensis]
MRWIPSLLWRPFAALSAHYALLVNVGTPPPVLRERLGLTWPPPGRSAHCAASHGSRWRWCRGPCGSR